MNSWGEKRWKWYKLSQKSTWFEVTLLSGALYQASSVVWTNVCQTHSYYCVISWLTHHQKMNSGSSPHSVNNELGCSWSSSKPSHPALCTSGHPYPGKGYRCHTWEQEGDQTQTNGEAMWSQSRTSSWTTVNAFAKWKANSPTQQALRASGAYRASHKQMLALVCLFTHRQVLTVWPWLSSQSSACLCIASAGSKSEPACPASFTDTLC